MGKILVTGGTGFIGSHTCVALTNAGYPVVVMDNLSNSKVEAIARIIHHPFMVRAIRPILLFSITLRNRSFALPQEQTFQ